MFISPVFWYLVESREVAAHWDPGNLAIREQMIVTTTNKNDGFRQNIYRNYENCEVKA